MKMECLGHIISIHKVTIDMEKFSNVVDWPIPKNMKGVCRFLCLMGYCQKFISNYGKIARPLNGLTKKTDSFGCSEA